jgi:hypothetical protein
MRTLTVSKLPRWARMSCSPGQSGAISVRISAGPPRRRASSPALEDRWSCEDVDQPGSSIYEIGPSLAGDQVYRFDTECKAG